MNTQNKTRKVAVYPDGARHIITRSGGMWHWGRGNASSHMSGVKFRLAEEYGGHVETEPNPHYRPLTRLEATMRQLMR